MTERKTDFAGHSTQLINFESCGPCEICIRVGAMQVGVLLHSHVFFEQLHSHVNIQFFMLFTHSKVLSFFLKKLVG